MKKYTRYIYVLCLMVVVMACDDIIEDNISDDLITSIAPVANEKIESNVVQFVWNGIEGADDYRIQVNDRENNRLILDSLVSTTVFEYIMTPGVYQWRVRGENFAYETAYSFSTIFEVATSDNLQNQEVQLLEPTSGTFLNSTNVTLSWGKLLTATEYKFRILKIEGTNETNIFDNNDTGVSGSSFTLPNSVITEDAQYKWEVKAINDTSETVYFSDFFYIDTQEPPVAQLQSPEAGATVSANQEITFKWNYEDTGNVMSGITSDIQIATDDSFNDVIHTNANDIGTETYSYTFTTAGTYFWRVRGKDDAGNIQDFGEGNQIIIN